jgi:hypothetical protein
LLIFHAKRRLACSIAPHRREWDYFRSPNLAAYTRDFEVVHVPDFAGYAMNFGTDLQTPGRPHGLFKDGADLGLCGAAMVGGART